MVLAAVKVVTLYQMVVPLDKAYTLVLSPQSSSKEPGSIRICSWRQSCLHSHCLCWLWSKDVICKRNTVVSSLIVGKPQSTPWEIPAHPEKEGTKEKGTSFRWNCSLMDVHSSVRALDCNLFVVVFSCRIFGHLLGTWILAAFFVIFCNCLLAISLCQKR